ncbi:MAG: sulfur carrier protein ThiS adenylyltransferase ThiF [Oscillospiraceae bacterium]
MRLIVNGKAVFPGNHPVGEARARYKPAADLCIANGYPALDGQPLRDGDELNLIVRASALRRRMRRCWPAGTPGVMPGWRAAWHLRLGGLGSSIAMHLARCGVGRLLLADFDVVEPSNLNRQQYFVSQVGMRKTDALRQLVEMANPYVQVQTHAVRLNAENIPALLAGWDIVVEAFDDAACKAELVRTCLERLPGTKVISGSGMAGYASANAIETRRVFQNLYVCGDETSAARPGRGLMAPRVAVCAGHQANMALRLLLGLEEP